MNRKTMDEKNWLQGSISTYVLMLFGMVVVFYMMGFTSLWSAWSQGSVAGNVGGIGTNVFSNPNALYIIILTALAGITISALIMRFTGGQQILAYIVPLVFLFIFVNIFIFPIADLQGHFMFASGVFPALTLLLMAFFNLFLILSVIEFVRSGTT